MKTITCNINARGRVVRLLIGIAMAGAGVGLILALLMGALNSYTWWAIAVFALLAGAFQIYEGWAGWCVLRAMGFRTPV